MTLCAGLTYIEFSAKPRLDRRGEAVWYGKECGGRAVLAWLRLVRVRSHVDRAAQERLRDWDLNLAQFDVLAHVGAAEGISQQALADALLVSKGNVCQLLNRMERGGLIARCPEGRMNFLYLTEEGRRLHDRVVPTHECQIDALFSPLSSQEQRLLLRLLHKLEHGLRAPASP